MSRLADRLHQAREALFVGREAEVGFFERALDEEEPPFFVLHVFGPGGVGKSSLLYAFRRSCRARGLACHYFDTRDVEPSPAAFLSGLRHAAGLPEGADVAALAAGAGRTVLLVDTCEAIQPLDRWLRQRFLVDLPEDVLVVFAGRDLPGPAWRADPGWRDLVAFLSLRNLDGAAGRAYLRRRDVPEDQHDAVLAFTHGHPLAISLVADVLGQEGRPVFQPEQAPDVIKTLLERFVDHVPGPDHRAALEACALVRFTTEALLQSLLDRGDVHDLFEWLRGLSFVDAGLRGLFPHDLAREVLSADLRWRHPERHAELHRRARQAYTRRLELAGASTYNAVLSDFTFLHRDHPVVQPLFAQLRAQWAQSEPISQDAFRPSDRAALVEMVVRHEGEAAAPYLDRWLGRQPEGAIVFRDPGGRPLGFLLKVMLESGEDDDEDPALRQARAYLAARAPLREGERAAYYRYWLAAEAYQGVSPIQSLIFINQVRHHLTTPGLAFSFIPCRAPTAWGPIFAYADFQRVEEADFGVGDRAYHVFGHDWRAVPPAAWLDRLAERHSGRAGGPPAEPPQPVLVLSRADFEEALRQAFTDFSRPDRLRGNPLLRSRLVVDEGGPVAEEADRIERLRRLLAQACDGLEGDPGDARYVRALRLAYLQPAPTHEIAAERLDVPYSTFRRHLKRGRGRVADVLWQREIGSASLRG